MLHVNNGSVEEVLDCLKNNSFIDEKTILKWAIYHLLEDKKGIEVREILNKIVDHCEWENCLQECRETK